MVNVLMTLGKNKLTSLDSARVIENFMDSLKRREGRHAKRISYV